MMKSKVNIKSIKLNELPLKPTNVVNKNFAKPTGFRKPTQRISKKTFEIIKLKLKHLKKLITTQIQS